MPPSYATDKPADTKRCRSRGIWASFDDTADMILSIDGALAHRLSGIRVSLFCPTIAIPGRPCCLVDEPIGLAFRVARDAAKTFLHFAAHVPGGTGYPVFVHRSVLSWSDFVSRQAAMKRFIRNEKSSGIAVGFARAEKQTATEGGWSCSSRTERLDSLGSCLSGV